LALLALGVIAVAAVAIHRHGGIGGVVPGTGTSKPKPVRLAGIASYDPDGDDGQEHSGEVRLATDGSASTFWLTSRYHYPDGGLGKPGVGIVLDAASPVALKTLTVTTDTPGFKAQIKSSNAPDSGFAPDSDSQTVSSTTKFELNGTKARYFLIWITQLPVDGGGYAHVNEVKAAR
jgi:putative peptidoglycan lipid II flippase